MARDQRNSEEAKLIEQLVVVTGRTKEQVVMDALRRELAFVEAADRRPTAEQILEGAERVRQHLRLPLPDHGELLYDERGLRR